jgi:hypothetical protein
MSIMVEDDEAQALREALDNYLPGLRYELARVKVERDRHPMVMLEEKLTALRKKLG